MKTSPPVRSAVVLCVLISTAAVGLGPKRALARGGGVSSRTAAPWEAALERAKRQQDREIASAKRQGKKLDGIVRRWRQKVINASTPLNYYMLGRIYYFAERMNDALPAMQRALVLEPLFWPADYALAQLYHKTKRLPDAERHLAELRRKNPGYLDGERFEVQMRMELGQWRDAYNLLRGHVQRDPNDWNARRAAAQCLLALEQWQHARVQLRKLILQFPKDLALRQAIIQCHLEQKDWKSAVVDLRQLRRAAPNDPNLLWQTGLASFQLAQEEKIAADERSKQQGVSAASLSSGWQKRLTEARTALQTLDRLKPGQIQVMDLLQTIHALLREHEAQLAVMKRMRPLIEGDAEKCKRLDELIALLEEAVRTGRMPGAAAAGDRGPEWGRNPMVELLERCIHADPKVRRVALHDYLSADIPFVDSVVYRRYDARVEPDAECRLLVVRILGKYRTGQAEADTVRSVSRYIALALEDPEPRVRTVAAEELGLVGAKAGIIYILPQLAALRLTPLPDDPQALQSLVSEYNACRLALRRLTDYTDVEIGGQDWVPAGGMEANREKWNAWLDSPAGVAVRLAALKELGEIVDVGPRWHLRYILVDVMRPEPAPASLALESYRILRDRVAALGTKASDDPWWATFPRYADAHTTEATLPQLRAAVNGWWKSLHR